MLYLVEYPENENFDSVLDTAWFAIGSRFNRLFEIGAREQFWHLKSFKVTMSTIGYGNEQVPKTILGKIVTVKCAIFGIICMGK